MLQGLTAPANIRAQTKAIFDNIFALHPDRYRYSFSMPPRKNVTATSRTPFDHRRNITAEVEFTPQLSQYPLSQQTPSSSRGMEPPTPKGTMEIVKSKKKGSKPITETGLHGRTRALESKTDESNDRLMALVHTVEHLKDVLGQLQEEQINIHEQLNEAIHAMGLDFIDNTDEEVESDGEFVDACADSEEESNRPAKKRKVVTIVDDEDLELAE